MKEHKWILHPHSICRQQVQPSRFTLQGNIHTLHHCFSFDRYHSHQGLTISSLMHSYPSQQWNTELAEKETTLKQQQGGSMLTKGMTLAWDEVIVVASTSQPPLSSRSSLLHSKFDQPLPIAGITQLASTRPYHAGLTPLPSAL